MQPPGLTQGPNRIPSGVAPLSVSVFAGSAVSALVASTGAAVHRLGPQWTEAALRVQRNGWQEDSTE